ncbi:TonB-dependent receptor [Treponema sp. TIM-1]|uniref:TonB-dependent receptor plug domain-containing protein n=1 Tax=Treponema sp. TIM-1 TaxID=2898417 RepID=UPI00397F6631
MFFPRAGKLFPAFILFCLVLASLFPQEAEEGDDFFDEEVLLLEDLEGITITASPETTQQLTVITREEIENAHAPDLAVLLQETLDLGLTRYGPYGNQTDINMRGFDSQRIAFLINGVPVNSPMTGDFDIFLLDLSSVDRIEVIYGGSDSKYNVSGSLGGVINIITVKKEAPGLRIGGSFANTAALPGKYYKPRSGDQDPQWQDLVDTQNFTVSLGYGAEKSSWSGGLFANRAGNHFLFKDYYGRTLRRESNEVWDTGGSLSYIRDLPDEAKLILGGDLSYGDKTIPLSGTSDRGESQRDFSTRQNLLLDMPRAFRDELSSEASLSYAWSVREYAAASRHDQQVLTAINRWTWYPLDWLTLTLGGDYRYAFLDSTDMGRRDRHDGGLYLTAEFQPMRRVLLIPSIKAVFPGSGTAPIVPVPKLGFVWTPTDALTLKNNYFRSFKIPDFEDLYWNGGGLYGNPDLKSEDGWGADLGAAYQANDRIRLEGFFFTQWTVDSIHWYPSGGTWKPTNVGEAVFFGLDAKLDLDFPLSRPPFEKIGLSFSYHYLLSYLLSYGYSFASDKRIPYMPRHTVGLSLALPWARGFRGYGGSLQLSGHYEGRRYADTVNLTGLKPYFLLNANLTQGIGRNCSVFAVLRNILNQSYESFDDYYMPGLTITLGVRVNFSGI